MNLKDHSESKLSLGFDKAACANNLYISITVSYIVGRNKISFFRQLTSKIQVSNTESWDCYEYIKAIQSQQAKLSLSYGTVTFWGNISMQQP